VDDIKGYVVRYTNDRGTFYVADSDWLDDFTIATDEPALFDTLSVAVAASRYPRKMAADVSIFCVHADGRKERLPSYEEALAEIMAAHAYLDKAGAGGIVVSADPAKGIVDRPATLVERIEDMADPVFVVRAFPTSEEP